MKRIRWIRLGLVALVALVTADLALTLWVVPGGVYVWKPLPPFGACMTDLQREWLELQQRQLRDGVEHGPARFDRELGWCPVERWRSASDDPLVVGYDSIGARSEREYDAKPPPEVVRVACFGDSFTHGDEVSNADTWERQIEVLSPRYEVLNFGVGGYGTDQALLRLRRTGLHGARVACIGFLVENIGRNVNRYRPWYRPPSPTCGAKPRFVLRDGALELLPIPYSTRAELVDAIVSERILDDLAKNEYWHADTHWSWTRWSSLARFTRAWFAYRRREPQTLYSPRDGEPYRVTLELLSSFRREALERGAEHALVLVLPSETDLKRLASGGSRYWQPLVDDLSARGVDSIDLSDALLAGWHAARTDATRPDVFALAHYSRQGNAIVARGLTDWLDARCTR